MLRTNKGVDYHLDKIKSSIEWLKNNVLAVKKLFLVAGCITVFALFLSIGITAVLFAVDSSGRSLSPGNGEFYGGDDENKDEGFFTIEVERPYDGDEGDLFRPPSRTNFLLVGLDNQLLADAIMVGTFYRDSGYIHLMSVPRDMVVRIPTHRLERMRADGLHPPHTLKINEMRSHGGRVHGIYYLQEQLAEMFGVEFHFYIEVEIPAFRRLVDVFGGVEMYIPRRLFYESLDQNPPLRINVPAGLQLLDGEMAEGVVRYRQWPMGDLERNRMQKEFMTQLIQQATTREALLTADPMELIRIGLDHVRTNIGIYAARYIPFAQNVSTESVRTFTMPGSVGFVGAREFFIPDPSRLPSVISDVFYTVYDLQETEAADDTEVSEE